MSCTQLRKKGRYFPTRNDAWVLLVVAQESAAVEEEETTAEVTVVAA